MLDETTADAQADTDANAGVVGMATAETTQAPSEERTLLDEGPETEAAETVDSAPEDYDFSFPEGIEPDQNLLGKFVPVAKDLGLSQEKAQKVVSVYADHIKAEIAAYETRVAEAKAADRKVIEAIPNYKETILVPARRALSLAAEEDRKHITKFYGDDPAVLRLLAVVGKKMSEDRMVDGKSAHPKEKAGPESLYKPMK